MWMRVCKKIICLFAALCMIFPMAAIGQGLTLEALVPVVEELQNSPLAEMREIMDSLRAKYYSDAENYYWYYMESSITDNNILYEGYLELEYESSHYIDIAIIRHSTNDKVMFIINHNGKEPSMETVAKYFNLGLRACEIRDDDEENYHIEFSTEIDENIVVK